MSEQRIAMVHLVLQQHLSPTEVARRFNVSRKTLYKWLRVHQQQPHTPLDDRTRRPRHSPTRAAPHIEQHVIDTHDQFGWGARKIHAYLLDRNINDIPSINTVNAILRRHQRTATTHRRDPQNPGQRFEHPCPNDLWQMDFKGPLEVARQRMHPLTIIDDHSRYLLNLTLRGDHTHKPVFDTLWNLMGEVGMPNAILCDNEFATAFNVPRTISWFDSCLLRLGINPKHGRPYHPQTQGKIERLHRTFEDELYPRCRRDRIEHFNIDAQRWRMVYNTLRPHEALGDKPPITRWTPSTRPRPASLPEPTYDDHAILRKVSTSGDVQFNNYRLLAGRGLTGQHVQIEQRQQGIAILYCHKLIRLIPNENLVRGHML